MEQKEKDYKEERFEFTIYANDNIICKRNFRIYNYVENSMNTLEFKDAVDSIVNMIDKDLKSKSRVWTWYNYIPECTDENDEFSQPLLEPWACTFKFVVSDNKRDVITKIWDGYAYPRAIREKVDLTNKSVKVTNRDGQTFVYDKESYFKANAGRLSFDQEVVRAMIMDKSDVLLQITKKICEVCSPSREELKEKSSDSKFISNYTVFDTYKNDEKFANASGEGAKEKKYAYSLYLTNRKNEKDWEQAVQNKTRKYLKTLY